MNRTYYKWHSASLDREMELLVFGNSGARLLVYPSRLNRFYEYEDHGMVYSLRHHIEAGLIQLFCIDSIDGESLYCFEKAPEERVGRHLRYEQYVIEEVLPFTESLNPGSELIAHGCSLGAYHAVSTVFRYPERFQGVLAFSGRYDLTQSFGDYHTLFHGYADEAVYFLMPSLFLPNLKDMKLIRALRKQRIILAIGEDDFFYENNRALCTAMDEKRIRHEFHVWCGNAHRFRYWRQMVRIYIDGILRKPGRSRTASSPLNLLHDWTASRGTPPLTQHAG